MDKNEIVEKDGYFFVKNNPEEIKRVVKILENTLDGSNVSFVDAISSLLHLALVTAYGHGISKPQFLSNISNAWEAYDRL